MLTGFYREEDCKLEDLETLLAKQTTLPNGSPAIDLKHNIPIYDAPALAGQLGDPEGRQALLSEWADVLVKQSGALVLRGAVEDQAALQAATDIFEDVIEDERASQSGGDHFAGAGANDRVWNALQKLCLRDASVFVHYFKSPSIAAVCEAYLGPDYQMTAQVNLVRPGGRAQVMHRDYHLGFMSQSQAARYPAHAHMVSASATLQGAVAHCDMPVESGPTKLLPFSQLYGPGYLAYHRPEFQALFESRFVQLPLQAGDALFFSPALFHAAGDNDSADIQRMANLMQIGSAMGRTLEAIDRAAMAAALYPVLLDETLTDLELSAVIAAAAEGYPFPTNLDTDPPLNGLASESQAGLMHRALAERMPKADFEIALGDYLQCRKA